MILSIWDIRTMILSIWDGYLGRKFNTAMLRNEKMQPYFYDS